VVRVFVSMRNLLGDSGLIAMACKWGENKDEVQSLTF
jgi:hypothetical protein